MCVPPLPAKGVGLCYPHLGTRSWIPAHAEDTAPPTPWRAWALPGPWRTVQEEQLRAEHTLTLPNEGILHAIPHPWLDLHFQRPLLIHQPENGKSNPALSFQLHLFISTSSQPFICVSGVRRTPSQAHTCPPCSHLNLEGQSCLFGELRLRE